MRFTAVLVPLLGAIHGTLADAQAGGLYPPGLLPLINHANTLLATGQFNDAARSYSQAIEQNPTDYLLFYKRATAYLSLQRHTSALSDFQHVLTLTTAPPPAVHLQIARIHAKDGQLALARAAARTYSASSPGAAGDADANDLLFRVGEAEVAAKKAERARRAGLWTACVEAATLALQVASHSSEIRGTRAECGIAGGDMELGVGDLSRLIHLSSPSPALFMRIFRLSYFFLPPALANPQSGPLATLKQCLYYDPDSKPCKAAHRLVKQLDKAFAKLDAAVQAEDWPGVIALGLGKGADGAGLLQALEAAVAEHTAQDALRFPAFAAPAKPALPLPTAERASPRLAHLLRMLCVAHTRAARGRAGEGVCRRLLAMDLAAPHMQTPEGWGAAAEADALAGLGEAALVREEWEEAVRLLERAFEKGGRTSREVHGRLQRAQKLLKQSKQKDYYKVLGVARDADAKTIKKAFRVAAKKAHPDKGGSETKMAAVNEAYEVLSNPELRQRFDNGDDPNDPSAQQGGFGGHPFGGGFPGGGGHPFAQFFDTSGGGGGGHGGYQFHFNGQGGGPRRGR